MKKKKKIYEGRTKKLYETDDSEQLILEFTDGKTIYDGEDRYDVKGKGVINNQISSHLFEYLEGFHIPTHFIKTISQREMLIRRFDRIPIVIMIHNLAAGSLCQRFGLERGNTLEYPITEYFLKDSERRNPMINASHAIAFGYVKSEEIRTIDRFSAKVNAVLKSFFSRRGLALIDFKLEFGHYKNKIILGDEMSPDTCRFWDLNTNEMFDKNHSSIQGSVEKFYEEMQKRIFNN